MTIQASLLAYDYELLQVQRQRLRSEGGFGSRWIHLKSVHLRVEGFRVQGSLLQSQIAKHFRQT